MSPPCQTASWQIAKAAAMQHEQQPTLTQCNFSALKLADHWPNYRTDKNTESNRESGVISEGVRNDFATRYTLNHFPELWTGEGGTEVGTPGGGGEKAVEKGGRRETKCLSDTANRGVWTATQKRSIIDDKAWRGWWQVWTLLMFVWIVTISHINLKTQTATEPLPKVLTMCMI